ncbi:class I SAM-dependent methyltransferase [Pseudomarimonas arenosa]|uniref:Class I SAM-dependent methyltransferase n=1 Tax=Pseudomarimonas arenosa TaxID=2774145 RepID=A0AAW3ZDB0_9GAMM|nr:class I SAM-dependent methyltransferase [Pseudomarimonas arenosa]MBD8524191.1 class I SAM-dependent methyltransferase [Pseudomarimonas arenosa]
MTQENNFDALPVFDDQGRNLVDPADSWGRKTAYITCLQAKAITTYVGRGTGLALDLGCGYGRMSGTLRELGWQVTGLDVSKRVLMAASRMAPAGTWCVGSLPHLPFADRTFDLVLAQNLLRVLHLNQVLNVADGIPRVVKPGGRLVVVDNIRQGHRDFVPESVVIEKFARNGFGLVSRTAIRAARWWGIYLVRYGVIPPRAFDRLAEHELSRMASRRGSPRWQYHNVLFVFERFT